MQTYTQNKKTHKKIQKENMHTHREHAEIHKEQNIHNIQTHRHTHKEHTDTHRAEAGFKLPGPEL